MPRSKQVSEVKMETPRHLKVEGLPSEAMEPAGHMRGYLQIRIPWTMEPAKFGVSSRPELKDVSAPS